MQSKYQYQKARSTNEFYNLFSMQRIKGEVCLLVTYCGYHDNHEFEVRTFHDAVLLPHQDRRNSSNKEALRVAILQGKITRLPIRGQFKMQHSSISYSID